MSDIQDEAFQAQRALESQYVMPTYGRKPVELVSGQGMKVWDAAGNEYLDFIAGVGVISLGHCHPALVEALSQQAAKLIHVSNYYYIEGRGELSRDVNALLNQGAGAAGGAAADADADTADGDGAGCDDAASDETAQTPWQMFYTNSGAESNECAIKLARLYAKRQAAQPGSDELPEDAPNLIVSLEKSFHGRTLSTLAATAQPVKQAAFKPLPAGFISTPQNDIAALDDLFAQKGGQICAMLIEPIQGESGVHPCTREFLQAARRLCTEHGALLMFDEVQCGIFRTGAPFAFQQYGVVPDVVTIAKGIGGGMPMGICAAQAPVAAAFEPGDHGSTFGGSCLAIAAARCVLATVEQEGIAQNAAEVGAYLQEQLRSLPEVTEVRGMGLMVAADLQKHISAPDVVLAALDQGLLLNYTGPHTLRFLPPLVCTKADIDTMIQRLAQLIR